MQKHKEWENKWFRIQFIVSTRQPWHWICARKSQKKSLFLSAWIQPQTKCFTISTEPAEPPEKRAVGSAFCSEAQQKHVNGKKEKKMTAYLTRVSRPLLSLSIFLFPVFGSTPSCPVLYLPCPCSDREIHTWRTLSVGYCMFTSRHQHIHSVPHCDSHLSAPPLGSPELFPNASYDRGHAWKMDVLQPVFTWLKSSIWH